MHRRLYQPSAAERRSGQILSVFFFKDTFIITAAKIEPLTAAPALRVPSLSDSSDSCSCTAYILFFFFAPLETKELLALLDVEGFCFFSSSFFAPPFLLLNQKNGLTVCKTRNETCLTLPGGAVNPLQWAELSFICLGFGSEFLFFAILLLVDVRGEEEKKHVSWLMPWFWRSELQN